MSKTTKGGDDLPPDDKPTKEPTRNGKGLPPNSKKHLRAMLRRIIDDDFKGNMSAAARSLKISQSMMYEMVSGGRGGGMKSVMAVANFRRVSVEEVLGGARSSTDRYPNRAIAVTIARQLGFVERAIVEVQSIRMDKADPPPRWWLERIQVRDREIADPFSPEEPGEPGGE